MFDEDLPQWMEIDDFGERVTRANATTFNAIFDLTYADPLDVAGSDPQITTLASNNLTRGEAVTVRGVQYQVRTVEPDGTGFVTCRLSQS